MAFGLGRGLEALIPTTKPARTPRPASHADASPTNAQDARSEVAVSLVTGTLQIAIEKITPNPHQPRKRFTPDKLEDLANSIKAHGILEPLVVSPSSVAGSYILIAGERRLRAAEMAGFATVPVVIRETDNQQKLELALVENIQRQDLNPLEEARAMRKLVAEFKLTQVQVARRLGRSAVAVSNTIRLLDLAPDVQQAVLEERISEGHARAILTCKSYTQQIELLLQVENLHLSVRQIERLASRLSKPMQKNESTAVADVDPMVEEEAKELSRHLGAKVQMVNATRGGRIVIEYYSEAERQRVVRQILKSAQTPAEKTNLARFTV